MFFTLLKIYFYGKKERKIVYYSTCNRRKTLRKKKDETPQQTFNRFIRFFFSTSDKSNRKCSIEFRSSVEFSFEIIESYTRYNQWLSAFSRVGNVAQRLRIYHIFSTKLSNRENAEYATPFVARYLDAILYFIFPPHNVSLFELNATFSFFFFLFIFFLISHRDASN